MDDRGAPLPDEVERVTNTILKELGDTDLESALTVLTSMSGQLIASISGGNLADVRRHSINMAENIKRAAYAHCAEMSKCDQ